MYPKLDIIFVFTQTNFIATNLKPLFSKRSIILPISPRWTASGFSNINVRSKSSVEKLTEKNRMINWNDDEFWDWDENCRKMQVLLVFVSFDAGSGCAIFSRDKHEFHIAHELEWAQHYNFYNHNHLPSHKQPEYIITIVMNKLHTKDLRCILYFARRLRFDGVWSVKITKKDLNEHVRCFLTHEKTQTEDKVHTTAIFKCWQRKFAVGMHFGLRFSSEKSVRNFSQMIWHMINW